MRWLISTALRVRFVVVALALLLMILGGNLVREIPLDVFPEFAPPRVEIQTEVPSLSAQEVEQLITIPIESAVNGIPRVDALRSTSVLGLSSVLLIFERGVNLMEVRQLVQERLANVTRQLPDIADPPVILQPLSATSRMLKIGMQSDSLTQMDMTTLSLWTVRPRLMAIPGVANVAVWGQRERQLQVQVDPDRLRAHNLTINDVIAATASAVSVEGGAFIDTPNQRFNITHIPAIYSVEDLAAIVVASDRDPPLTLGQVAVIVEGSPPPIGDAIINDEPGILLIVEKQLGANTLEVTRVVEAAMADLAPALQGIAVDTTIFRPATYIENSLANLNFALLVGCLLVVLVLAVFLYDWRTALISIIAIPLSLISAALILDYQGGTLNTMVLAGLIVALGEVVDDAIIDVENIMRRLRLNVTETNPRTAFQVVLEASLEVRTAVVFGSLIVALVLIPVFLLEGLTGSFFQPLALAYVTAILASLVVALIVTPALSYFLLPQVAEKRRKDAPLLRWLKTGYRAVLQRTVRAPYAAILAIGLTLATGGLIYPGLGQEMLPQFREYDFLMHWLERPGTSLDAMNRITIRASRELRAVPGVRNFGAHVGRAEVADEVVGIDFTELWISLDPEVPYEPTVARVQEIVDGYPGLFRDLLTYLRERIREVLTGASGAIVVRLYGPDLETLREKALEISARLQPIEGLIGVNVQNQIMVPQVEIKFKPEAAAILGLVPKDLRRVTEVLLKGEKVGEVYEDQMIFDVVVQGVPRFSKDIDTIRSLIIDTPSGAAVPLRDVADIYLAPTPNQITRENVSRRIDITMNVADRALDAVAQDVDEVVDGIQFDNGYYPEVLGEYVELEAARSRLLTSSALGVIAIFILLLTVFNSFRISALMFLSLPVALVGGIIGAFIGSELLSLGSFIGFITVLGISARNSIMLVSHYRHLETQEGMGFGPALVLRGAEERLAPILMTALTAGLALLPLVLGGLRPGHEIEHPMAVVIIGGLVTSTLLNLFLIPPLYLRFAKRRVYTHTH